MNLKSKIIRELRDAIVNRDFKPGEHLKENDLCKMFNVSRTPVREALNQLEKEGFIKIIPGVGAKTIKYSLEEILQIYDVLIILEGAASRFACSQISKYQIGKLEEYNFLFERAIDEKNKELIFELNAHFHWLITEATKNPHLISMRANYRRLTDVITRIFPSIPGQLIATLSAHNKIVDSLKSNNPTLAEFVMREHLEDSKKNLKAYLLEKGMEL